MSNVLVDLTHAGRIMCMGGSTLFIVGYFHGNYCCCFCTGCFQVSFIVEMRSLPVQRLTRQCVGNPAGIVWEGGGGQNSTCSAGVATRHCTGWDYQGNYNCITQQFGCSFDGHGKTENKLLYFISVEWMDGVEASTNGWFQSGIIGAQRRRT